MEVLRSRRCPGILSSISKVTECVERGLRFKNQRKAIFKGVVRHAVKMSAGNSGFVGSHVFAQWQTAQLLQLDVAFCL